MIATYGILPDRLCGLRSFRAFTRRGEGSGRLLACEIGQSACDKSLLTPEQAQEAGKSEHDRNLLACKIGEGYCRDSLLSPDEAKEVAEARERSRL
ncbi:MAG: hypothetical protein DMG40_06870 [Acidobacteria bacterium]|nr:MAG: hypothetical protein DMG40_06870 [Acidobacteriota bacterium]